MTTGGFLSGFFMPLTFVAFLVSFGRYFTTHWFALFMPAIIGCEILLFITTGGVKIGEIVSEEPCKVVVPNADLAAARQRNAEEEEMVQKVEELKKNAQSPKHEKANAKKAEKAEKAAAAAAAKKNK